MLRERLDVARYGVFDKWGRSWGQTGSCPIAIHGSGFEEGISRIDFKR